MAIPHRAPRLVQLLIVLLLGGPLSAQPDPRVADPPQPDFPLTEPPPDEVSPDGRPGPVPPGTPQEEPPFPGAPLAGARIALDYLALDPRNERQQGFRVDQFELRWTGHLGDHFGYHVVADVLGIDSRSGLKEAWCGLAYQRLARLRVGLVPMTTGLEHSQPSHQLPFVSTSFPAALDGRTDLGAVIDGELQEGLLSWVLAGGLGEGFDLSGERLGKPVLMVRLVSYPLRWQTTLPPGLFFSAGLSHAEEFQGELAIPHPLRGKIFRVSQLRADETRFVHLGYGLDLGRLRFLHEWIEGGYRDLRVPGGGTADLDDQTTAMQATVSYRFLGPAYDSRPYRQVASEQARRARLEANDPLLEAAIRYSNADIDRRFFDLGFTDYTTSSQEFRTFTVAVNYGPQAWYRFSGELVRTIADQFPALFDSHGRDTSFLLRVQVDF